MLKKTLVVLNGFIHDFAAGIWLATIVTIVVLHNAHLKDPAVVNALNPLERLFFWGSVVAAVIIMATGAGRTFTYVDNWYGEDAERERRKALMEVGQEFADAGMISRADDLVFLRLSELEALSRDEARDWKALIAERRLTYEREARRRQVPRVLVSDGRAFYEGVGANTDTGDVITGSPVSPGVVEGIVHVVLSPHETQLTPGEILVCPGTDPAWTPLFMAAGGLITEVGGMMTHGSVVAREYGIPAVVGVHEATIRLKNGQKIRVDGTAGKISILE